jgi:hypothetical protein
MELFSGLIWLTIRIIAGALVKCCEILEYLSYWRLLEKVSAPWS